MNDVTIKTITETDALFSLVGNASWILTGENIVWVTDENGNEVASNLGWHSPDINIPSRNQIKTRIVELQAIADSIAYQAQRKQEYPPLENLADALYWQANGDSSKMATYLAQVAAVKEKYPKGTV
jgi:hypothetical protein